MPLIQIRLLRALDETESETTPPTEADGVDVCLARDRLHIIPETWFTQLAFGERPDAVENV